MKLRDVAKSQVNNPKQLNTRINLNPMNSDPSHRGTQKQLNRQQDSFLLEREALDNEQLIDRSIAVNSADFGESKLLTTERKVLMQAEFGKESSKL